MKNEFTPTEDLVLEVLIARARLGENLWTFNSSASPAIYKLASKGWVTPMSGIVENSVRAMLTDRAIARWLSYDYKKPNKDHSIKKQVKEAKKLRESFGGDEFWVSES